MISGPLFLFQPPITRIFLIFPGRCEDPTVYLRISSGAESQLFLQIVFKIQRIVYNGTMNKKSQLRKLVCVTAHQMLKRCTKLADVSSVSPSQEQLTKGLRSKRQPLNSLRWSIYVFNSVVNTKLLVILSHRRSTSFQIHHELTCTTYLIATEISNVLITNRRKNKHSRLFFHKR